MRVQIMAVGIVAVLVGGCVDEGPQGDSGAAPAALECAAESKVAQDRGGAFPFFASVDELVLAADVIVVGTVTTVSCEAAAGGMRDRRAVIDVEQTLYGEDAAELEVVSPGDEHGGPMAVDGVVPPVAGESAVWFLRTSSTTGRAYDLVGPQGRYLLDGQTLTPVTQDTVPRVHEVAQQIAALGPDGLGAAINAAAGAIDAGELADTWTNQTGSDVVISAASNRGPVHCGWQDMRFLVVEVAAVPAQDPQHRRVYVANPEPGYGLDGWEPDADLPADAIDTGWRRGNTQLWLAAADGTEAAFLVDGPTVERLPLDETGQGCE